MKQYRYVLDYDLSMPEMIGKIMNLPEYKNGYKGILQLVEPNCESHEINKDLEWLNSNLTNLDIYGMTSHGALSRETHSIPYKICSVIFFEESNYRIDVFDCSDGLTPSEAGIEYQKVLSKLEDVKGVLMMSSDFALCPEKFIDKINSYDPKLLVFGALAGTREMGDDRSKIFLGSKIYERGILTIAFMGKNLFIDHHYALGFKSLGKELTITKSDDKGIVYEINDKPAFLIYKDHLGVGMNDYFFENTSSFPFYLKENGHPLARVALDYHKDGALAFATEIPEGSKVSLSYSTAYMLLKESFDNAVALNVFTPDAILIYCCMSRRMLMGDDMAELEFEFYQHICSNATWSHGYGEVLHADGLRGFLNASLVAIGLREGPVREANINFEEDIRQIYLEKYNDYSETGFLPLSFRLVNFLESTTKDLRDAVDQLFKVASLDELTQIYNRRALNYFMKRFIEKISGYNGIAVIMVDVDHFKRVNDTYGHDVGDMVLRDGVSQVKYLFTQADIIGRWGGEEFVGIKPNITKDEALDFSEMLRQNISEIELDIVGHITVSIGVTMVQEGDTEVSVFKRIDDALYEAKETGRNKVVFK
ncbi:MAG: GGDEF domain-containing protein [Lachnospiraceae bacterium]|nr:GGDEF domain-containing protein [Lachnospiraceae bacterium]